MDVFEMVVAIVAIAVIGGILRDYIKKKDIKNSDLADLNRRLDKLEAMEQRIQTLETIITDRKETLKREIDSL